MRRYIILIFFLQSIVIISSLLYEVNPEEQKLLNQTKGNFIVFDVKAKEDVKELSTISCFKSIGYIIEGPYDTVFKTSEGSVIFQEGEKVNTIKKLQCFHNEDLNNVTIIVVVDGNTIKTDTNYIQFVPKYVVKPKEVEFDEIIFKNSNFSLEITLYDENKFNVIIGNNVFILKKKDNNQAISLINCDIIPKANKKDIINVNCQVNQTVEEGDYDLERYIGKIEGIVPLVSGDIKITVPKGEENKNNESIIIHLKIFLALILLFL